MKLLWASGWGTHVGEGTFFLRPLSPLWWEVHRKPIESVKRRWKKPQTLKNLCCKWSGSIKLSPWEIGNGELGIPKEWETFMHLLAQTSPTFTLETWLQKINGSLSACSRVGTIRPFPLCPSILDSSFEVILTCGWRERNIRASISYGELSLTQAVALIISVPNRCLLCH